VIANPWLLLAVALILSIVGGVISALIADKIREILDRRTARPGRHRKTPDTDDPYHPDF
jgi:hypothetical protein